MKDFSRKAWAVLALLTILQLVGCNSAAPLVTPTQAELKEPQVHTNQLSYTPSPVITEKGTAQPIATSIFAPAKGAEFGVEITTFTVDFNLIRDLGAKWLRYNGVIWSDVEDAPGDYHWEKLAGLEEMLKQARSSGLKVILVVRGTPAWAQKVPGSGCGPIREDALPSFANFLSNLVSRYSGEPFTVHTWEIWNEPDVDPSILLSDSPYGCYGDKNAPDYGGSGYADMLKAVVPAIHQADPVSKVLIGGLLLDCDPTNPGQTGQCKEGNELPPKFFDGVLSAGVGDLLDYISFHGYSFYNGNTYSPIIGEYNHINWSARGGAIEGKINYIHELLTKHQLDKPLFLTETALLCHEKNSQCTPPGPDFYHQAAEYGSWMLVRNYAENVNTIWFTFDGPGWRFGSILNDQQQPNPVYYSLQYAAKRLMGSTAVETIGQYPGIDGFKFTSPSGSFIYLAPFAAQPPEFSAPAQAVKAYNIFGQEVALNKLSPLSEPVFIDIQ